MADDLLRHFREEHAALGKLADEFATSNPGVAARLRLARGGTDDPHVERLLEGTAFLAARVRQRLDDEFPEVVDSLLGVLYPHYLAPFPACMTAQFVPAPELRAVSVVPRHSAVRTEVVDGTPCRFRTTTDVPVWPIQIEDVKLSSLPLPALPVRLANGAAGVLRISLTCLDPSSTFEALGIERLRFHVRGPAPIAYGLHELLCSHAVAVAFADGPADPYPVTRAADFIEHVGFGADEAVLPWPAQGFAGFRLMSEYFAFPEKFLYLDIRGIDAKTLSGAGRRMEIYVYLDQVPPHLERGVERDSLALFCVPLVNLFPQRCEPIEVDWTRSEYRVDPDLRRPGSLEVWSVERVRETRLDGTERPWRPFFRMVHGDADDGAPGGSYLPVRRPSPASLGGSDVFLTLDDPEFGATADMRLRLSVDALCTNRDHARRLPGGANRPQLTLEDGAASITLVPLRPPTTTLRPPQRAKRLWQLLTHLSLSHLSVIGGPQGAGMLREVMRLYDLRDDPETRGAIAALLSVSSSTAATRLPGARAGSFCRGLSIRLTFNQAAWQGGHLFLMASVLERFLALHGTVNGFVQSTAYVPERSQPVARWPARAGTRTLV